MNLSPASTQRRSERSSSCCADCGLKEKLLAAHRGGIKHVIIPAENEKDLKEIPENVKENLVIHPVKWMDDVLELALERLPEPRLMEKEGHGEAVEVEPAVGGSRPGVSPH